MSSSFIHSLMMIVDRSAIVVSLHSYLLNHLLRRLSDFFILNEKDALTDRFRGECSILTVVSGSKWRKARFLIAQITKIAFDLQ